MLLFEQESLRWGLLTFEALIGLVLILASKSQPFPLPSRRFGWIVLSVALLLTLGQLAPNPVSVLGHLVILTGLGSFGLLVGIHHLIRTRREVLIAPFAGFLFCVGIGGLMVSTWPELNTFEQWSGFGALVMLGGGQTWLVFRGLLIGRLPLAWSQALNHARAHATPAAIGRKLALLVASTAGLGIQTLAAGLSGLRGRRDADACARRRRRHSTIGFSAQIAIAIGMAATTYEVR